MNDGSNKWQMVDEKIAEAFKTEIKDIQVNDQLKERINEQIRLGKNRANQTIREERTMKRWNTKRRLGVGLIAAAVLATTCFGAGKVVSIGSTGSAMKVGYDEIDKAEKKLGFEVQAVKDFKNGYAFKELEVIDKQGQDEAQNVIEKYKSADVEYSKEGKPVVSLYIEETGHNDNTRTAKETDQYKDINLSYYLTHYKSVPEGYQLTDEDKANEAKGDYQIAVGSDEGGPIEESEISTVDWEMNGKSYCLLVCNTDMTTAELFDMAKEVIDAK